MDYIKELKTALDSIDSSLLHTIAGLIYNTSRTNQRVFVAGNGGSAMTAGHMMCDFGKVPLGSDFINSDNPRINIISLADSTSLITAIANDSTYDYIFSEQLKNHKATSDDILIVLSVSGHSPNIKELLKTADSLGLLIIGLYGSDPSYLATSISNYMIKIPHKNYGIVEDCHSVIMHMITEKLKAFYAE